MALYVIIKVIFEGYIYLRNTNTRKYVQREDIYFHSSPEDVAMYFVVQQKKKTRLKLAKSISPLGNAN